MILSRVPVYKTDLPNRLVMMTKKRSRVAQSLREPARIDNQRFAASSLLARLSSQRFAGLSTWLWAFFSVGSLYGLFGDPYDMQCHFRLTPVFWNVLRHLGWTYDTA